MAANSASVLAARKGCPMCGQSIKMNFVGEPWGEPFSSGPYEGRYWCSSCWILYWADHPEHLSDEGSRRQVADEARLITLERGGLEVLYREGENRICLTDRGTLLFEIRPTQGLVSEEYDPERFAILMRALQAVEQKEIAGYHVSAKSI